MTNFVIIQVTSHIHTQTHTHIIIFNIFECFSYAHPQSKICKTLLKKYFFVLPQVPFLLPFVNFFFLPFYALLHTFISEQKGAVYD
jgi:hypothetical protein